MPPTPNSKVSTTHPWRFFSPHLLSLTGMAKWLPFPEGAQPQCSSSPVLLPCFILSDLKEQRVIIQLSDTQTRTALQPYHLWHADLSGCEMLSNPVGWMMAQPGWEHNMKQQRGMEHHAGLPLPDSFLPAAMHPPSTALSSSSRMCQLAREVRLTELKR